MPLLHRTFFFLRVGGPPAYPKRPSRSHSSSIIDSSMGLFLSSSHFLSPSLSLRAFSKANSIAYLTPGFLPALLHPRQRIDPSRRLPHVHPSRPIHLRPGMTPNLLRGSHPLHLFPSCFSLPLSSSPSPSPLLRPSTHPSPTSPNLLPLAPFAPLRGGGGGRRR